MIPTAWQTTGPFFPARFIGEGENDLTVGWKGEPVEGERIEVTGLVLDAGGEPIVNAILELVQADGAGRIGPDAAPFKGWGRTWTDDEGRYRFRTIRPGGLKPIAAATASDQPAAPVLRLMVTGSGLMRPLVTEVFFPDDPANESDRQLGLVAGAEPRKRLMLAVAGGPDRFRLDLRLGGPEETPFLVE